MIPTTFVHDSWKPLVPNLHLEGLKILQAEVMPNEYYYPKADAILAPLYEGLFQFRIIKLRRIVSNPNHESIMDVTQRHVDIQKRILHLPCAFTSSPGREAEHMKYWDEWTKRMVAYISKNRPCVWHLDEGTKHVLPYISKPFVVRGYNKETIYQIPADPDANYIFLPGTDKDMEYTNIILSHKKVF